jgi:hypothetical protein
MHEDLSLVLTPNIMPDSKFSDPLGSLFWIARQIRLELRRYITRRKSCSRLCRVPNPDFLTVGAMSD